MITTQSEAKRFFVDKVVTQARSEGMSLSEAEREMLLWSESDPNVEIDPTLPNCLKAQISDEDYERKIVGLLARRFSTEVSKDPRAEGEWKHASRVLHEGDHYIVIMLDDAITHRRSNWWQKLWGAWKR